jgi:2-keto-3-deoxy-L-rhamnonate aldolase RhmA
MIENRFKSALATGGRKIGLLCTRSPPYATEVVAAAGND